MSEVKESPNNLRKRTKQSGVDSNAIADEKCVDVVCEDESVSFSDASLAGDNNFVHSVQVSVSSFVAKHQDSINRVTSWLFLIGYFIFLGFAIAYDASAARTLVIITIIVVALVLYVKIRDNFGDVIYSRCLQPCWKPVADRWHVLKWFVRCVHSLLLIPCTVYLYM